MKGVLIWLGLGLACLGPVIAAAFSPFLAWRDPVYIGAGFAGICGLAVLVLQPLSVAGHLPGLRGLRGRQVHRWLGVALFMSVVLHVLGLWLVSPPDVMDVLLFRSPTPFAVWGVLAMWAVFLTAALALFRQRLGWARWRLFHSALAVVIVGGAVLHALLIEGAMERISKTAICVLVVLITIWVLSERKAWRRLLRR